MTAAESDVRPRRRGQSGRLGGRLGGVRPSNAGANQTDWRLPNIRELHSLVDFGTFNPALPSGHPFENFEGDYWSSTTVVDDPNLAWVMSLTFGRLNDLGKDSSFNSFNVTAVRGTP